MQSYPAAGTAAWASVRIDTLSGYQRLMAARSSGRSVLWMGVRHVALFGAIVVLIALLASSPTHAAFWIVLAAFAFVGIAYLGALSWFYGELRK